MKTELVETEPANIDEMTGYCPFCGGNAASVQTEPGDYSAVVCLNCFGRGPRVNGSCEVAVDLWNTRYSVTKKKLKSSKKKQ